MIETNALREKVLDLAIRGKLVPQDPNDEPSSVLLERIRAEKQRMVKDGKIKAVPASQPRYPHVFPHHHYPIIHDIYIANFYKKIICKEDFPPHLYNL